jgi:TIR domain
LSYVGEPFEYDVFVSYAHAEVETDAPLIRDWSRHVAEQLRDLLATALNPEAPAGSKVTVFLDDRLLRAGQPLTETLREKAKRSALLLVLMSPLYPRKSWCVDELTWFFEQAVQDGRGHDHCTVLRIQPVANDTWPKLLRDERGAPVLFLDLVEADTELPVCLTELEAPELARALLKPFIEIKGKLKALRELFAARRRMAASVPQRPADRPVIYLDASPEEEALWQGLKGELKDVAIVRPANLAPANGDADPLDRERQKQRQLQFASSDGLVLLHGSRGAWLEHAVAISYNDRRLLLQRQRNLPWAILDRAGSKPPVADDYEVPCVPATSDGWQRELLAALGLASPDARPAP